MAKLKLTQVRSGIGQSQRHRGVGDVVAGFHGVDGLPADARLARQCGRRHAAFRTNFRQPVQDLGAGVGMMVTCG